MDNSHFALIGKESLVEELLQLPQSFTGPHSNHVKLIALAGLATNGNRRQPFCSSFRPSPPQPLRGHLNAESPAAYHRPAGFEHEQFAANVAEFDPVANFKWFLRRLLRPRLRRRHLIQLGRGFRERPAKFAAPLRARSKIGQCRRGLAAQCLK